LSPGCCSLARGHDFSKGYYARVEDGSLYGRLFRLFFRPLVRALADATERREPGILSTSTRSATRACRGVRGDDRPRLQTSHPARLGLEVGTLGEAFAHAGFAGARRSIWGGTSTTTAPSTGRPGSPT